MRQTPCCVQRTLLTWSYSVQQAPDTCSKPNECLNRLGTRTTDEFHDQGLIKD